MKPNSKSGVATDSFCSTSGLQTPSGSSTVRRSISTGFSSGLSTRSATFSTVSTSKLPATQSTMLFRL